MDREVSRPVLGFSEGMFSICILSFPNSPSTSTSWQMRLRPGVAIIWTRVESGPMPARLTAADTLMFAGNPLQASLADSHHLGHEPQKQLYLYFYAANPGEHLGV